MTDHKTTLRLSAEDLAVIARLRERLGITSNADVIRFALRYTESHGPMRPKEREMKTRYVWNARQLHEALSWAAGGPYPLPLPTLPFTYRDIRYEWLTGPLGELLDRYGPDTPVRYVGEKWGPDPFTDKLENVVENVLDIRPDYLEGIESRLTATEPGEGILYDEDGTPILLLASEDDLED